ncbi:MAG: dephospho-CoA kinase [Draconibacterium sp.]
MALKVGITGGIGSGKSTICKVFEKLSAPVFEADPVAKKLIDTDAAIRQGLIDLFGPGIYTENNGVDRKKLAEKIFNDEIQLAKVNALVHPAVRAEFLRWSESLDVPYVVHEAAILFESGFYKMMDYTILVTAPEEDRIKRVSMRDGSSRGQVIERINKQWSDNKKRKLADIEIKNDNRELILPQIINIDKQLREYGKIW